MKNTHWAKLTAICTLVVVLGCAQTAAAQAPQVRVDALTDAASVRIEAKATGPFEYTTYRPSETLFVVDLAGVSAAAPAGARVLKSEVVSSYRVLQYRSGDMGIVRIEILMRSAVEPRVERAAGDKLVITFDGAVRTAAAVPAAHKPAAKIAPVTTASATLIEDVSITRRDAETLVTVSGNGALKYEAMRLTNPERLVLDFAGTRARAQQKNASDASALVAAVRVGQFKPSVSRVVIDLKGNHAYEVTATGAHVAVAFRDQSLLAAAPSIGTALPARIVEPKMVAPLKIPAAPMAEKANAVASEPASTLADAASTMQLPQTLTNPVVLASAPVAPAPEPPAPVEPARSPSASPQQAGKYAGEPISVNFKDLDLKDFFRLIHEISGLNVVVDPTVRGTITIVLDDVPWDQALDIALRNNNLDKQLEGNVLRIATRATMTKEAQEKRDQIKAEAAAVEQDTRTFVLSYAKAAVMRDTLKRFLSDRGEILADDRSNTLIVRDIPSVFPALTSLMTQLDRKTQQVEIEARVVAASRTFAREIGTQFGFATSSTGGRSVYGGLVGRGDFASPVERGVALPVPPLVSTGGTSIPLNVNLGATAPNSGATFSHASPNFALDFIISAAESKGVGKLLSKPKIFTQNNKKGTVQQGTKIPLQTVVNNTITVQYIDAVLKLEVTPQITAEGTVFMEVLVENTAIDDGIPRILGIPALTTQKAESNVLISDGGTVVVGGVHVSQQRTDVNQVPLFGSIPFIGHLFKRTAVSSESRELLFFLTPRVIPD